MCYLSYSSLELGTTPDGGDTKKDPGKPIYVLCFVITILTGIGVVYLIHRAFHEGGQAHHDPIMSLQMITIAMIISSVSVCAILKVEPKQYESIFAAIAGYVLGSLGKHQTREPQRGSALHSHQTVAGRDAK
jgi:hypothetical protein